MELAEVQEQHAYLVEQCREGDVMSFKKLYQLYAGAMFNTSLRILNNRTEAEDVLQESFIDAFHHIHSFENKSSFGAWLKQIVVNKSINHLKKKRVALVEIGHAEMNNWTTEDEDEEKKIQWRVDQVREAITRLPAGYRTVLSLYLLEGYDHEEIAQILGVAESTTRTQYIRAKQKLLTILKRGA